MNFQSQFEPLLFQYDFERSIRADSLFFRLTQMELAKEVLSKSVFCPLKKVKLHSNVLELTISLFEDISLRECTGIGSR